MNDRRITAAIAILALGPAAIIMAGGAQAAQAGAAVHGCPSGDVCEYGSKTAYRMDNPPVIDTKVPGLFRGGVVPLKIVVNNTAKDYSSEGDIILRQFKNAYFCEYYVDAKDEQEPGATENPADGATYDNAIATGTDAKLVDSDMLLPLSDCDA